MSGYLLRRLLAMLLTLWVVYTLSFFLMYSVPGGPFSSERSLPPEIKANVERRYNLDQSLWRQYVNELGEAVQGDFGYSFKMADFTVNQVIAAGFPVSATLGLLALSLALAVGLSAGTTAAALRGGRWDVSVMAIATVGISVPSFVLAGILILLFVFHWHIFPAGQWGTIRQAFLPAVCLAAPFAAEIARLTRASMLEVLSQNYIRTATAKGLSRPSVLWRHALRPALMPVVSFLGPTTAGILTGSIVIEEIFAIPGLGYHFLQSATQRDYTLAMGLVVLYTVLLLVMNLVVDLCYVALDPRVRLQ